MDQKAAAEAVVEESFSNHVTRRTAPIRRIMAERIGLGKLKNPGSEKQTSLMMGIRIQHLST